MPGECTRKKENAFDGSWFGFCPHFQAGGKKQKGIERGFALGKSAPRNECGLSACGRWALVGATQKNMLFFLRGDSDLPCVYGSAARVNSLMSEQRAANLKHYPAHSGAGQTFGVPTVTHVTRETLLSAERHIETWTARAACQENQIEFVTQCKMI